MVTPSILFASAFGFGIALLISLGIVITKHLHGSLTLDLSTGVQKFHSAPTPRIGGIALAGGYFGVWFFLPPSIRDIWGIIGITSLPALASGVVEDFTKRVSARWRFGATIFAGLVFAIWSGYSITSIDMWGLDYFLAITGISIAFTAFAIGGMANAFNIIDGFHGLASGTLIIIFLAFATVGLRVDDPMLVEISLVMAAIMGGFFVINFPLGKLFLGDGGAYFAGFIVAVLAVMLPARNPEVSPWISLFIVSYPVTETIVSIVRRLIKQGAKTSEADSNHFHHAVHRSVVVKAADMLDMHDHKNPLTGMIMWILPLLMLGAISFCGLSTVSALSFLAISVILYLVSYRGAVGNEVEI